MKTLSRAVTAFSLAYGVLQLIYGKSNQPIWLQRALNLLQQKNIEEIME